MASDIEGIFEDIYKRKPSQEEKNRISSMVNTLKISENDSFVLLLMVLDSYYGLYSTIPEEIKSVVQETTNSAKLITQKKIDLITSTAIEKSTQAISNAAEKSAKAASVRSATIWIVICVLIIISCLSASSYFFYQRGIEIGQVIQIDEELLLKERDQWILTQQGKMAFKMSQIESLNVVMYCTGEGWKIEDIDGKKVCFPYANPKDNLPRGWQLP